MKINIIALGKIKDDYLKVGINDYLMKIKPYSNIEIIELKDEKISSNPNEAEINKVKKLEGEKILKLLKPSSYLITLDLNKKEYDSIEFSKFITKSLEKGSSEINFVIGGSYGLSDEVKSRANDSLSLSKMTFLHTMTRLILLEQIYRAFKIDNNEVYHK